MKKGIFIKNGVDMNAPESSSKTSGVMLVAVALFYLAAAYSAIVLMWSMVEAQGSIKPVAAAPFNPCIGMAEQLMPNGNKICYPPGRDISGKIHARGEQ